MSTPYLSNQEWLASIILYKDTFYLCQFETDDQELDRNLKDKDQLKQCYMGLKFETLVTSDSDEPDNRQVQQDDYHTLDPALQYVFYGISLQTSVISRTYLGYQVRTLGR